MKTLYISDLDGTLLNSAAELSEYTISTINRLIDEGMYFTFATARTVYSAKPITSAIHVNVPCILNNGASVYDFGRGEYVKKAYIPTDTADRLISAFKDNGLNCFVFKFVDGKLATCYDTVTEELMRDYVSERRDKFRQPFIECDDVTRELDGTAIYINSIGSYESLLPVYNVVMALEEADCAFYCDTYTKKWYLETFSAQASKGNGLKFLREKYGFDRIVAFGDNLNDLSMFKESDTKIAVGNANPELKEKADLIIDTNDNNGVADWLDREVNNKMSYKNVYGTDEYNKYIEKYMYMFDDKYITDTEVYKLSEGFSIREYIYDNKVKKCVLTETVENSDKYTTRVVYEYKEFYDHTCSVGIIIHHSNGHRYFPFHVDLYGISYLDIDTMEVYNYIPEGYTHLHRAPMGESFIITGVFYDKASDLIAYEGCYWAAPSDIMVGDFSNPLNFNPHLISLRDILSFGYYLYDDVDFKEWKDGRLYVLCDKKEEKSLSVDELRIFINELTDKGEK